MAFDRDHITSQLIYGDKIFCTTLFTEETAWKSFYILQFERLAFVAPWKLIRSHAVTPRWLDAKECIQSEWSKQRDSSAHEIPAADAGRFKSCISRKLFGG